MVVKKRTESMMTKTKMMKRLRRLRMERASKTPIMMLVRLL